MSSDEAHSRRLANIRSGIYDRFVVFRQRARSLHRVLQPGLARRQSEGPRELVPLAELLSPLSTQTMQHVRRIVKQRRSSSSPDIYLKKKSLERHTSVPQEQVSRSVLTVGVNAGVGEHIIESGDKTDCAEERVDRYICVSENSNDPPLSGAVIYSDADMSRNGPAIVQDTPSSNDNLYWDMDAYDVDIPGTYLESVVHALQVTQGLQRFEQFTLACELLRPVCSSLQTSVDMLTYLDYLQCSTLMDAAALLCAYHVVPENFWFDFDDIPWISQIAAHLPLKSYIIALLTLLNRVSPVDEEAAVMKLCGDVAAMESACTSAVFESHAREWFVREVGRRSKALEEADSDLSLLAMLTVEAEFWPEPLQGYSDIKPDAAAAQAGAFACKLVEFLRFLLASSDAADFTDSAAELFVSCAKTPCVLEVFAVDSCQINKLILVWLSAVSRLSDISDVPVEELNFSACSSLTKETFISGIAVHTWTPVRHLNFSGCSEAVDDEVLEMVGNYMPRLQCLQLGGCKKFSRSGLERLARTLPQYPVICDDGSRHEKLTSNCLKSLNLRSCTQLGDDCTEIIATMFLGLEDLCLYGVYRLCDGSMVTLANRYSSLRRLNICGCYKVTDMGRRFMYQTLPKLVIYNAPDDFKVNITSINRNIS